MSATTVDCAWSARADFGDIILRIKRGELVWMHAPVATHIDPDQTSPALLRFIEERYWLGEDCPHEYPLPRRPGKYRHAYHRIEETP